MYGSELKAGMNNSSSEDYIVAKGERKRAVILSVAERLFSTQGFAATRLEDVAEEVGLTRAALFYHFRDKQTLYDAMVMEAFAPLNDNLKTVLERTDDSIATRIESALSAWVDALVNRPTLARLILRFVADGVEPLQRIFFDQDHIPEKFLALFEEGRRSGELKPLHDDPFHSASAAIGTTVFYVGALSTLLPQGHFQPLDPDQVAAHKLEALHTMRRLLGIAEPAEA
jgi:TetR/AcrR family transcriptional regulator